MTFFLFSRISQAFMDSFNLVNLNCYLLKLGYSFNRPAAWIHQSSEPIKYRCHFENVCKQLTLVCIIIDFSFGPTLEMLFASCLPSCSLVVPSFLVFLQPKYIFDILYINIHINIINLKWNYRLPAGQCHAMVNRLISFEEGVLGRFILNILNCIHI